MPNLESATHYPGLVLFESTNLSVGRGTPIAFQVVGAPWLDPVRVRNALGTVPGVRVRDTTIAPHRPGDGKYPDRSIPSLRFSVSRRAEYDPTRLAVRLMAAIRAVHPDSLRIEARSLDERAGSDGLRRGLETGLAPDGIWAGWEISLEDFRRAREEILLYR
jgi:uncharacterized protein YbbC (DUF1343 family)